MRHHAGGRIDREGDDLLGRVVGDVLDVHAAFGGDHERHARGFTVDQQREIELLLDVRAVFEIEAVDLLAGRAGLHGDQRRAEHFLDELLDLVDRLGEADAALVAGRGFLELALAAAAGMDLALHHPERSAELLGGGFGFLGLEDRHALGNGHAEFLQHGLRLIFMDIHKIAPEPRMVNLECHAVSLNWHTVYHGMRQFKTDGNSTLT